MVYDMFLFTLLYRRYCTEYANLEYKEQWEVAPLIYKVYEESEFYNKYEDAQVNMISWLESIDWAYNITCECGAWEEFPADMPRHKTQYFEWLKNSELDATAYYKCPDCGTTQRSEIIPDFDVNYETTKTTI